MEVHGKRKRHSDIIIIQWKAKEKRLFCGDCYILRLPYEIILYILEYTWEESMSNTIRLICKSFNEIIDSPAFIRGITPKMTFIPGAFYCSRLALYCYELLTPKLIFGTINRIKAPSHIRVDPHSCMSINYLMTTLFFGLDVSYTHDSRREKFLLRNKPNFCLEYYATNINAFTCDYIEMSQPVSISEDFVNRIRQNIIKLSEQNDDYLYKNIINICKNLYYFVLLYLSEDKMFQFFIRLLRIIKRFAYHALREIPIGSSDYIFRITVFIATSNIVNALELLHEFIFSFSDRIGIRTGLDDLKNISEYMEINLLERLGIEFREKYNNFPGNINIQKCIQGLLYIGVNFKHIEPTLEFHTNLSSLSEEKIETLLLEATTFKSLLILYKQWAGSDYEKRRKAHIAIIEHPFFDKNDKTNCELYEEFFSYVPVEKYVIDRVIDFLPGKPICFLDICLLHLYYPEKYPSEKKVQPVVKQGRNKHTSDFHFYFASCVENDTLDQKYRKYIPILLPGYMVAIHGCGDKKLQKITKIHWHIITVLIPLIETSELTDDKIMEMRGKHVKNCNNCTNKIISLLEKRKKNQDLNMYFV